MILKIFFAVAWKQLTKICVLHYLIGLAQQLCKGVKEAAIQMQ